MQHILTDANSDTLCCGNCTHMKWEDTDGYGICNIFTKSVHCSNCCKWCDPREPINENED